MINGKTFWFGLVAAAALAMAGLRRLLRCPSVPRMGKWSLIRVKIIPT